MHSIQEHTFALAKYVHDKMAIFRHGNGSSVARLYCHTGFEDMTKQGPIINFNLLRPSGDYVGYAEVSLKIRIRDFVINAYSAYTLCGVYVCSGRNLLRFDLFVLLDFTQI